MSSSQSRRSSKTRALRWEAKEAHQTPAPMMPKKDAAPPKAPRTNRGSLWLGAVRPMTSSTTNSATHTHVSALAWRIIESSSSSLPFTPAVSSCTAPPVEPKRSPRDYTVI
ncbi:hypothetical protein HMPREF9566_02175 [Cutibacterium acnes HL045PA1]|nr:hypothetical protein HMPREF9566_02175 [Cutibacterium acnes HL045PA1]